MSCELRTTPTFSWQVFHLVVMVLVMVVMVLVIVVMVLVMMLVVVVGVVEMVCADQISRCPVWLDIPVWQGIVVDMMHVG